MVHLKMKVLVLFLFTGNPTMPYKTRGKRSFLSLKKRTSATQKKTVFRVKYERTRWTKREKGETEFFNSMYLDTILHRFCLEQT